MLSMILSGLKISTLTVKNAVSSGTLSVTINAFIKRFAFLDGDGIKTSLEQLLSSIILSDKLDEVVEEIILKLNAEKEDVTEAELKSILKDNTTLQEEDKLDAVCKLVMAALEKHEKTK